MKHNQPGKTKKAETTEIGDKEKLKRFLSDVNTDMGIVVNDILPVMVAQKELPAEQLAMAKKAFEELQGNFGKAAEELDKIGEKRLKEVGLTGAQLDLKLQEYARARQPLNETPTKKRKKQARKVAG